MNNTVMYTQDQSREAFNLANLVFNPQAMQQLQDMCKMLACESGMVPDHFKNKPADVMAVIMQSARWGLEPFACLQSTFVLQGKIGYEAKIIQSVASSNGGIQFTTEYLGDWSKIQGRLKKTKKTKYNKQNQPYQVDVDVPAWTPADEVGVGIRTTGRFPDGREVAIEVMLNTCYPRHSTNWTFDPQTQIHYTSVKRWVRRFAPHLGAGIKDYDDLSAQTEVTEKEVNPIVEPVKKAAEGQPKPIDGPRDIDALLNSSEGVTQFDDICNMIEEVTTHEQYLSVKDTCVEVVGSGELTEDEILKIRYKLETKRDMISEDRHKPKIN